jgi:hypothetical protein
VDEYWVCQHCRSLNRASSGRCYSCGAKFGSKPKEAPIKRDQPPPSAPPPPPAPPVSFAARPNPSPSPSPGPSDAPAYFSTPVAVQPTPYLTETRGNGRLAGLLSPIEGRVSRALAGRPIVSIAGLGYATILLLITLFLAGGLATLTGLHAATFALQNGDLSAGWDQLSTDQQGLIETLAFSAVTISLATLVFFSLFIGLSTHNAPGLGAEPTLVTPRSGGTMWFRLAWVQIRLGAGILVPTLLVWYGYQLPGLIVAVIVVEIAQRHVDDMLDWLDRPARHLPDLYRKLGVQGAKPSAIPTVWSALFRTANLALIAAVAAIPVALSIDEAMRATGREVALWQTSGYGPGQLALGAIFLVLALSTALCLLATMAVTAGLVSRQRTRRTLVRVGRSRSWLARPGEGAYAGVGARAAAMAGAAGAAGAGAYGAYGAEGAAGYVDIPGRVPFGGVPNGYGDDDRFVERYPQGRLPPGFSEDDTFASRVAQARGDAAGPESPQPGSPGAPMPGQAQQPFPGAQQQPAEWPDEPRPQAGWPGAPIPGQESGQQPREFPQPVSGWPGAQPQQPMPPPQPAWMPPQSRPTPGWPDAGPDQQLGEQRPIPQPPMVPQPAMAPQPPIAQPPMPQRPMAPQPAMPQQPMAPQPPMPQQPMAPQPPAGWQAQRPAPGPQLPQAGPPQDQPPPPRLPDWPGPQEMPEPTASTDFGRSTDPMAELDRASEMPRPPEGWAGPKPGGLLHRMGAQMGSAPAGPPGARDHASLNSPSTTSSPPSPPSPPSPDDASGPPSD